MNLRRHLKIITASKLILVISVLLTGLVILSGAFFYQVSADEKKDRFEQDIEAIKDRIKDVHIHLDGLAEEKLSLEETLANLETQSANLREIIRVTQNEIDHLEAEIKDLENQIEAQTEILKRVLVLLWQQSGASTFELIISSENFSDYLDNQEHLDRLKDGVARSVNRIQALSEEVEEERVYQLKLLDDQRAQEVVLGAAKTQKEHLLITTRNQEAAFQQQLSQLRVEQEKLEAELKAYLDSLLRSKISLGPVSAGEIIGRNGNTGWSTGPHLHLDIYSASDSSVKHNPLNFIKQNNLVWPMGGGGGWVSQGYRPGHRALDIAATEGTPVLALADGEIIHRGCVHYSNSKYDHFGVIINHGSYVSAYVHLQAPNNPKYKACSINRMPPNVGKPSIDYQTTE